MRTCGARIRGGAAKRRAGGRRVSDQASTPADFLVVLLGALLLTESVVLAATFSKSGKAITALRSVASDSSLAQGSTTFEDVPGMSLSINVPSNTTALLMIQFSADATCSASVGVFEQCLLRAVVDRTPVVPWPMTFGRSGSPGGERSTHWVAGPFAAGEHNVRIQYAAAQSEATFILNDMTLTVLRSKV